MSDLGDGEGPPHRLDPEGEPGHQVRHGEQNEELPAQQSFFVPKDEIIANDYDLSINKYKKIEYKPVEYPPTSEILGKIKALEAEIQTGLAELEAMLK